MAEPMTRAEAVEKIRQVANEALAAWDADRDSRVGKLLSALAGRLPGYRADLDLTLAALAAPPDADWQKAAGGLTPEEFTVKDRLRTQEHSLLVSENRSLRAQLAAYEAEGHEAAVSLMTLLVPAVSDAALVGTSYGWREVLEAASVVVGSLRACAAERDRLKAALLEICLKIENGLPTDSETYREVSAARRQMLDAVYALAENALAAPAEEPS